MFEWGSGEWVLWGSGELGCLSGGLVSFHRLNI